MTEEQNTMTTTSFYSCPKCNAVLKLVEHYFPRKGEMAFMLEYCVLTCESCNASGQGPSEGEAYADLRPKLSGK